MVDLVVCSGLKTREQMRATKTVMTARIMTARIVFCAGDLAFEDKKRFLD